MQNTIVVQTIKKDHLKEAAFLRSLFSERGFYSRMHWRFWENLFRRLLHCPKAIFLAAYDKNNNKVAGFVIATVRFKETKKTFKNRDFVIQTAGYLALMFIKCPTKLVDAFLFSFGRNQADLMPDQRWLTWVVHPDYRNKGVGTLLYSKLCQSMKESGVQKFYGSVDCKNNASNKAHEKFGARKVSTIMVENSPHYVWEHDSENGRLLGLPHEYS